MLAEAADFAHNVDWNRRVIRVYFEYSRGLSARLGRRSWFRRVQQARRPQWSAAFRLVRPRQPASRRVRLKNELSCCTGNSCSQRKRSAARLVARIFSVGQAASSSAIWVPAPQDMLEIIEDGQQLARCQILADAVHPHTSAEVAQAQRTGDGWNIVGRAESRTKINKDNPILERVDQVRGDSERRSRLARATSANQREQARLRAKRQRADVGYLVIASNQWRRLRGQAARTTYARHRHAGDCRTL
jgi:hypothetical protein